jgi:hypothetical protein
MGLQSDILQKAKSHLLVAFQERVDAIDSLEDLESLLENFSLEVEVSVSQNGTSKASKGKSKSKNKGARAYWAAIRKIAEEQGVSKKEARVLYLRNKDGEPVEEKKRRMPTTFGARISKLKKKYWRAVNKIVTDQGCSVREAQQIYKKSKAA